MDRLPKLREDITLIPTNVRGSPVFVVQDMAGLRKDALGLPPETVQLLPLFDGKSSIGDLQLVLMRQRGNQLVMAREVEGIVSQLDELLLLQTDRYRQEMSALREAFAQLDHRPPSHAGAAYPNEPGELESLVREILAGAGEGARVPENVRALIAPHIDLKVGRDAYTRAYASLREARPGRLVVLGTGHSLDEGLVSLTCKDYVTPLGRMPTERAAVTRLRDAGGEIVARDDFAHRREHSLEFQMLFLQHLLPDAVPVVPVLFGSFSGYLSNIDEPAELPQLRAFLEALAGMIDADTLVVAGVDLCHVGPKFGHPEPASHYEREVRAHDEALLRALCKGSVREFWAEGQRVQDRYHVCGFPVLACLLDVLPGLEGRILDYQVWHETPTRSAVSYAAAVLCEAR